MNKNLYIDALNWFLDNYKLKASNKMFANKLHNVTLDYLNHLAEDPNKVAEKLYKRDKIDFGLQKEISEELDKTKTINIKATLSDDMLSIMTPYTELLVKFISNINENVEDPLKPLRNKAIITTANFFYQYNERLLKIMCNKLNLYALERDNLSDSLDRLMNKIKDRRLVVLNKIKNYDKVVRQINGVEVDHNLIHTDNSNPVVLLSFGFTNFFVTLFLIDLYRGLEKEYQE